jgi:hypothetical protein
MPLPKPTPSQPLNLAVLNALLSEEISDAARCTGETPKCHFCQWVDQVAASDVRSLFDPYICFNMVDPIAQPLSLFAVACQMLLIGIKYAAAVKEVSFLEEMERLK